MSVEARKARIQGAIVATEVELHALESYMQFPGADLEAARELRKSLRTRLRRQQTSLCSVKLQEILAAQQRVDPLQTDIERQVEAESAAHGPDLGGSRRRGR